MTMNDNEGTFNDHVSKFSGLNWVTQLRTKNWIDSAYKNRWHTNENWTEMFYTNLIMPYLFETSEKMASSDQIRWLCHEFPALSLIQIFWFFFKYIVDKKWCINMIRLSLQKTQPTWALQQFVSASYICTCNGLWTFPEKPTTPQPPILVNTFQSQMLLENTAALTSISDNHQNLIVQGKISTWSVNIIQTKFPGSSSDHQITIKIWLLICQKSHKISSLISWDNALGKSAENKEILFGTKTPWRW